MKSNSLFQLSEYSGGKGKNMIAREGMKVLTEEEEMGLIELVQKYDINELLHVYNKPSVLKEFYNKLVTFFNGLPTISPIHMKDWPDEAARWLSEGKVVTELGCGDGTFGEKVLMQKANKIEKFYLVDFSPVVLQEARVRLKGSNGRCEYSDISIEQLGDVFHDHFDRVISINTIGDTRVEIAFKEIYDSLKRGGLFRATLYNKNFMSEFWSEEQNRTYFELSGVGLWFTPATFYRGIYQLMGHIHAPKTKEMIDFVRIQRYYTEEGWKQLLENQNFEVIKSNLVIYPKRIVLDRWGKNLTEKQKQLIEEYNGFPECYDIIAKKK